MSETTNLFPKNEGPFMQGPTVSVAMGDLITMMAKEVAQKVVEEVRAKEIAPLEAKILALEVKLATPNPDVQQHNTVLAYSKGIIDGIWKLAAGAALILEIISYMKSH